MKIKLNKNYKITLIVISILLLLCVTIGVSYAYWQITKKQTNANVLSTGCFEIAFEETGSDISLNNALPISDQKGLSKTPYKFKLKNICTYDSEYYVTLNSIGATDKLLNENAIKYAFDVSTKTNPTPKILGTAPENTEISSIDLTNLIKSYYLKAGYLRAGEEKEFSLYLWMNQDAPMSEMNKTFSSKIYITSIATTEAPLIANLKVAANVAATEVFLEGPLVKNTIEKLEFVETNKVPADAIGSWDVSAQQNGAITAWYYDRDKNGKYEVYIGQEEGVIANSNSVHLFRYLENLNELNLDHLIVSDVTNMGYMFHHTGYNSPVFILDLGDNFNTSNVTNMAGMFNNAGYNSPVFKLDLGDHFDTSNVTRMDYMFQMTGYNNTSFTLDLGDHFDTSNVTNMQCLFFYTGYSSTIFTLDLGNKFDTSNVTNMAQMFYSAGLKSTIFTLNLGRKINTSNVTDMNGMFTSVGYSSPVFTLNLGDNFDTSNVTTMKDMFYNTGRSNTNFILNLGEKFNTDNVTTMQSMFRETGYSNSNFTLNLKTFNFSNVTSYENMFNNSKATHTAYVKNASDKTWVSSKGFKGSIIDCSSNTCP